MKYEKLYKNLLMSVPTWKEGVVKAERNIDDHKKEGKKTNSFKTKILNISIIKIVHRI